MRGLSGEVVGEARGGLSRLASTDLHTDVVAQFADTGTALAGSTTYDPLGKVVAATGAVGSLGYQSEWTDAVTNRVNMHARRFNVDTGQFDTRDSVANSPVPDSVDANRYQYGDANPLTVTDPTGHWGLGSLIKSAARVVTRAASVATTYVHQAASSAASYVSHQVKRVAHTVKKAYHKVKRTVKRAVRHIQQTYHRVKKAVSKQYHKAKKWVKKKVKQGRKWVAQKVAKVKKKVKKTVAKIKQAGQKIKAAATRVVKNPVTAIKDAASATKKFVQEHKDAIIEIAAIGGAILAGVACTAATAGAGAIACMVGAGALINLAKDSAQGDIHSVGDALGCARPVQF